MNGTLTENRFSELVWREGVPRLYSLIREISLEEAKEHVFREYDRVGEGRVEWYDIKYWFRFLGLGDDWRELLRSFQHEARPFSDTVHALGALNLKHELIVTSNASRKFIDIELGATGLRSYFTRVFSSTTDFGQVKKTPDVYLKVCRALGIEPKDMVHVGDHRQFDFTVPRELGIRAFHLDRQGKETGESVVRSLSEFCQRLQSCQ